MADTPTITAQFKAAIIENLYMLDSQFVTGWIKINDNQSTTWNNINNSESTTWNQVSNDQSPGWTNVNNNQ